MSSPLSDFNPKTSPVKGYRFGPFELELRSGELRKHGVRIRLRKQSVQILSILLEHRGEVVLREDIRRALWPDNTVVEFDHGINTAMQRLREAMGDSPDDFRYIETLAGRGYRFVAAVETLERRPLGPVLEVPHPAPPPSAPRFHHLHPLALAGALCLVAVALWLRPSTSGEPPRNWVIPLGALRDPIPSPDGRAIVYRDDRGLYLRRMDSLEAETRLYSASNLIDRPTWSPDGTQVLFQTYTGLVRTAVPHGPPVVIWPGIHVTRGYSWGPDGSILVAEAGAHSSLQLFAGGAPPVRLEVPQLKGGVFYEPEFLPDAGRFLFTWAADGADDARIYLATLTGGKIINPPVLLRNNRTAGHFARDGDRKLFYVQDDKLYAQTLNLQRGSLEGSPKRILDNVLTAGEVRHAYFSVSPGGALAWRTGTANSTQLTWFDRSGKVLETAGPPSEPSSVALSPREDRLWVTVGNQFGGLIETHQSALVRLPGVNWGLWTSDGDHVLFRHHASDRVMERDIARGTEREVAQIPDLLALRALSPDGKDLIYAKADRTIHRFHLGGSSTNQEHDLQLPQGSPRVQFSPDGRWTVYSAYDTPLKRMEVFVKPFAFAGLEKQVSVDGGRSPVWRGDGREILFLNRNKIQSVRVSLQRNALTAGAPEALFPVRVPIGLVGDSVPLAVVRDGSRILFAQAAEDSDKINALFMTNWRR
jgi:DNA-binding winged helix-turn-helix (wHTH) protein/Tol biopolymer transport system component